MPSRDDVRADVADVVRGRASVAALDQAARHGADDAAVGVGHAARRASSNDPRLTDQEIQTIVSWIDGGAPKGDDGRHAEDAGARRRLDDRQARRGLLDDRGLQDSGRRVDRLPVHPDSGEPAGGPLDTPRSRSSPARVRTSTTSSRTPSQATSRRVPAARFGPTNIGGVSPNKPGSSSRAWRREAPDAREHDIILQIHYTTNGKEAVDRTQIGLIFAKEPPAKQIHGTGLARATRAS